jgi:hypothetical protein
MDLELRIQEHGCYSHGGASSSMKRLILLLLVVSQALSAQKPEPSERHEFVIANFRTESGVTLPEARVVYGTYGQLNAQKNNVVLLPSHYMATFHGYEWLIGPGRALDTSQLFLVADGAVWQRAFLLAQQYRRALSRASLPGDDDSR